MNDKRICALCEMMGNAKPVVILPQGIVSRTLRWQCFNDCVTRDGDPNAESPQLDCPKDWK